MKPVGYIILWFLSTKYYSDLYPRYVTQNVYNKFGNMGNKLKTISTLVNHNGRKDDFIKELAHCTFIFWTKMK